MYMCICVHALVHARVFSLKNSRIQDKIIMDKKKNFNVLKVVMNKNGFDHNIDKMLSLKNDFE